MAHIHTPIPSLKLNDGTSIPMLGYGTGTAWAKNENQSKVDQATIDGIKLAIKLEYTHLDGAESYHNESELGTAINQGGLPREKLYITTKVSSSYQDIEAALRRSLKKLQVDHVDLYLIHEPWIFSSEAELQKTWTAMENVQSLGLTKSIGVSNFLPTHLAMLLKTAKVTPAVNQIEFHPYLQHTELLAFHKQHNIATVGYGPLAAIRGGAPGPVDDYLAALAKKYAVSFGEVCLRWCIDQDVVVLTTSSQEQRLSDYLRAATFKLTPKEIEEINSLGKQKHFRVFWNKRFESNDTT